jgi:hypothetical protein
MAPSKPKTDPDKEAEGPVDSVKLNRSEPNAPSVPRRVESEPEASLGKETPKQVSARRVKGAKFIAGQWTAADGTALNDAEAQAAHRAMDEEAAKAREKAQGG